MQTEQSQIHNTQSLLIGFPEQAMNCQLRASVSKRWVPKEQFSSFNYDPKSNTN